MKVGIILTTIGAILILLFTAYEGWRFGVIPLLAWEAGMVTWDFIALIILYGLAFLVPGAVLLLLGIRRIRNCTKTKKEG